jgi:hypothetical protein
VQLFQCHGGPNQKWTLTNGLIHGLNGTCLDVRGGLTADQTPVQVFPCHGGPSQLWQFLGHSIDVSFYLDTVAADQINESGAGNDTDEVYVLRRGSITTRLLPDDRLPRFADRDDYYKFHAGQIAYSSRLGDWINHDRAPVGRPVLWAGTLAHQQTGEFLVILNEQDNKDWPAIKAALTAGLSAVSVVAGAAGADAVVTAAIQAARSLVSGLPANSGTGSVDDVIGAFSVRFTNDDGELKTAWIAIPEITIAGGVSRATTIRDVANPYAQSGTSRAVFNMSGTGGGSYRVAAALDVNRRPALTPWEYLGHVGGFANFFSDDLVSDRCNRPQLVRIQGRTGPVLITDQPTEVRVNNPTFGWTCASSHNTQTCPLGTNLVVGQRGSGDVLKWYCFREGIF